MKANWLPVSRHWDFPQISEEQESWRTWRRKSPNSTPERSSTESRPLLQRCFGSVWTELNCQTSSFLDFPLKIYSTSLGFCKICLRKAVAIAVAFRCCGCTSEEQSRKKKTNGGYRLVWESLNCWMIVQLICFPTSYGTIYVCFHSWFYRICSSERRRVCLFLQPITARVLYLWTRFFQPGPSIFAWLVWFY